MFNQAFASDIASSATSSPMNSMMSLLPLVAIFVVFYFLLIRPQMKKQKQVQEMINGLKKGDEVVTAGGIIGKIVKIEDNLAFIEIANEIKIKIAKNSITDLVNNNKDNKAIEKK